MFGSLKLSDSVKLLLARNQCGSACEGGEANGNKTGKVHVANWSDNPLILLEKKTKFGLFKTQLEGSSYLWKFKNVLKS